MFSFCLGKWRLSRFNLVIISTIFLPDLIYAFSPSRYISFFHENNQELALVMSRNSGYEYDDC